MVNPQDDSNYGDPIRRMRTQMRPDMPPPTDPNSAPALGEGGAMGSLEGLSSPAGVDLNSQGGGAVKAEGPPPSQDMAASVGGAGMTGGQQQWAPATFPVSSMPPTPMQLQTDQSQRVQAQQGATGTPLKPSMPPPQQAAMNQQQAASMPKPQPVQPPATDRYSQYASQQPEYAGRPISPAQQAQPQSGMGGLSGGGGSAPMNKTPMKPNMPAPTSQIKPNGNPTYQTRKSTPQ